MGVYSFVITVGIQHHLVTEDFVIGAHITAVSLAFRIGERELVEVKTGALTACRAYPPCAIQVVARRRQTAGEIGRTRELGASGIQVLTARGCRYSTTELEVVGACV